MINKVYEFNKDIVLNEFPEKAGMLKQEDLAFAYQCIAEEAKEMLDAQNFDQQVDAVLDLIYFALGNLYKMGIPSHIAEMYFQNVHDANMTKVRGTTSRNHEADASKPDGWKPPFHDIGVIND